MKVSISPDDIKNQVTHAGPDYQGPAKLSDFASLILPWQNYSLISPWENCWYPYITRQNCWYRYLYLTKLLIPLSYPEKIATLILPWRVPFPAVDPGWSASQVVSLVSAGFLGDVGSLAGGGQGTGRTDVIVLASVPLLPKKVYVSWKIGTLCFWLITWLSAGWTGGALGRLEGAEVGWPGRRVGPDGKGGSLKVIE